MGSLPLAPQASVSTNSTTTAWSLAERPKFRLIHSACKGVRAIFFEKKVKKKKMPHRVRHNFKIDNSEICILKSELQVGDEFVKHLPADFVVLEQSEACAGGAHDDCAAFADLQTVCKRFF